MLRGKLMSSLAGLAAILLTLGAPAALAETRSASPGNIEGTPFVGYCPQGQGIVGWSWNSLSVLEGIAPVCQDMANGRPTGPTPKAPVEAYGYDCTASSECKNIVSGGPRICADGGYVASMLVSLNKRGDVHHVRPLCKGGKLTTAMKPTTTTGGAAAIEDLDADCPSYAIGVFGTIGKTMARGITSIGLICFSEEDDAPQANNGAPNNGGPLPAGDDDDDGGFGDFGLPLEVQITLDRDGINFGAKGRTRVLREDSTLYADRGETEIDFLERGDKVLVTGCENKGRGWCEVIKPRRGLIWGGDLK